MSQSKPVNLIEVPIGTPVTVYQERKDGPPVPIAVGTYMGIQMYDVPAESPQAEVTIIPVNEDKDEQTPQA